MSKPMTKIARKMRKDKSKRTKKTKKTLYYYNGQEERTVKIILIHGYANNTLKRALRNDGYTKLYQIEFEDFVTTVATNGAINMPEEYIEAIHESVDYLSTLSTKTALFTEIYNPPAQLYTKSGEKFEFVGGLWGYNSKGTVKYQYA